MTSTSDPKHWRDRADEARRIAELLPERMASQVKGAVSLSPREAMLRVAEEYEGMALWAEGNPRKFQAMRKAARRSI